GTRHRALVEAIASRDGADVVGAGEARRLWRRRCLLRCCPRRLLWRARRLLRGARRGLRKSVIGKQAQGGKGERQISNIRHTAISLLLVRLVCGVFAIKNDRENLPRVMSVAALRHSLGLRCPSATDCNSCFEVPRSHRRDRRSSETHLPVWPASLPLMHPHNRFTGSNRQTLFVLRRNLRLPTVLSGYCLIEVRSW